MDRGGGRDAELREDVQRKESEDRVIASAGFDVPLLVTRPPVDGPGKKNSVPSPWATAAEELKVPIFQPEDVNHAESGEYLAELEPDLFVVCDYGQILSADTLAVARLGTWTETRRPATSGTTR